MMMGPLGQGALPDGPRAEPSAQAEDAAASEVGDLRKLVQQLQAQIKALQQRSRDG
jgi:hypothetical protein